MLKVKKTLPLLLLFLATSAIAGWDRVYVTKSAVHYIDPDGIGKEGDLRRVSTLQDLKAEGERGERSIRALMEYDCKNKRVRPISATAHRGQMATGEVVATISNPAKWISIAPESAFNTIFRYVCST